MIRLRPFRRTSLRALGLTAALAGAVLLTAAQRTGYGQAAVRHGTRAVTPAAVNAVDAGFDPVAWSPERVPAIVRGRAAAADGPDHASGEVLVKFADAPSAALAAQRLIAAGARSVQDRGAHADFDVIGLDAGADALAVARALAARPDVAYAQPAYGRRPLFVPDDPYFAQQWNLAILNMTQAWDINPGAGDTVIAAVIDTGVAFFDGHIDYEVPAFAFAGGLEYPALGALRLRFAAAPDLAGPERFVAPRDFVWDDEFAVDLDGHGTHIAGAIGQLTDNGIGAASMAFNVRIMPLKVLPGVWDLLFGAIDECCDGTDADVAEAIRYAVEHGARVINLSLGGEDPSPAIDDAVRHAVERGAFVAMAAGNEFLSGNLPSYPAASAGAIDGAMVVGAVDRTLARAGYSSTGAHVEIAAPGGYVARGGAYDGGLVLQQTLSRAATRTFLLPPELYGPPRFDEMVVSGRQGTSFAAPHVAGLAALLMTQGISDPAVIEAAIKYFAVDLGASGRDDEFGHGLINPHATLRGFGLAR